MAHFLLQFPLYFNIVSLLSMGERIHQGQVVLECEPQEVSVTSEESEMDRSKLSFLLSGNHW